MKTLYTIPISITLGAFLLFAHTASAASFFFTPATGTHGVGGKFTVDLKIDSEGVGMNAAQATIRFPKETLEVISVEKTNSTFNFWLTDPTFSNQDGVISFAGGTPYGISGASMQVLRITFTSKGSGDAPITVVDSAITASDGSGTNILSKTGSASFTISPTSASAGSPQTTLPAPQQIVREVVPASNLPVRPNLTIPLYPDPTRWYNTDNAFTVQWDLPREITGISTALNKQPSFIPAENSEGLFDSKTFEALPEGTWYLHVRFRNSIGWGSVSHYRLAVDTKSPLPFDITSPESEKTDTPSQLLQFRTTDALSGLSSYQIKVNDEDWIILPAKNFSGKYKLSFNAPGEHHIIVKAIDQAENSIETSIDHEIIPIASPTFTFVNNRLYSGEPIGISVKGTALPDTDMLLQLKTGGALIASSTVRSNTDGNWEYIFDNPLRNGSYIVSIQSKDARGALSLVVDSPKIKVTGKYTNFVILLIIILAGTLFGGFWFYERRKERTSLRISIAESDTAKAFKMLEADVEKLNKAHSTATSADDEFITKKLEGDLKKMSGYIREEIKKAKK